MTRDRFRDLFIKATERVIEFTRELVWNEFPDTPRFLLYANQSYDKTPDGQSLTAFPEDTLPRGQCRGPMTGVEAIDFMWRDGEAPQWIDVKVIGVADGVTQIELQCCGRYVAEEERMYYHHRNLGPFGVKGPAPPPGWDRKKHEKFDFFWQSNPRRESPAPAGASHADLNLPCPLVDLDESRLPRACRDTIARMVGLGHRREHLMISTEFDVHISEELTMLHTRDDFDPEDDESEPST